LTRGWLIGWRKGAQEQIETLRQNSLLMRAEPDRHPVSGAGVREEYAPLNQQSQDSSTRR
jgi:hypothetical protein